MNASDLRRKNFVWRGLAFCLMNRSKPVLELVADSTYPHLFRIRYPDGWRSSPANLSRAKDAAYGHALTLLVPVSRPVARLVAETDSPVPEAA